MEEPNDDIDTETLQAQIDLSMAYAQNLVASWLSGSNSLTQSSSRAAEAETELQGILRRPPRLGVGAPLPENTAPSQTRLVKKLEGGKRRIQQMENGTSASASALTSTMIQNNGGREEEEDSAEESRAGAIRKRARVDPFEPGKKKRRRKDAAMEEVAAVTTAPAKEDVVLEEAPQTGAMEIVDATTRTGRKKKKKKKNAREGHGVGECVSADGGPVGEAPSPSRGQNAEPSGSTHSVPDERNDIKRHQQGGQGGSLGSSYSVLLTDSAAQSPVVSPKPPRMSPQIQQLPNAPKLEVHPTPSSPILNLTGPPSIAPEQVKASPHKKRKRKRKKKKRAGDQGAGDNPP